MSPEYAFVAVILLLIGNAFFVAAEFSLVAVRRSAIEPLAAKGSKKALRTLSALENISFLMAGAQLGITLCSLALGAVAEPAIAHVLEGPFHEMNLADNLIHPVSFVIALAVTVFAHVIIGEMVPKNIALARPEKLAMALTSPLLFVTALLKPLVHLLNLLANLTLKLFGITPKNEVTSSYTRDEMADLVRESRREGYLSEDNEQLLSGALSFDAHAVKDIIMPIEELVTVEKDAKYSDIESLSASTGYSRFPVIAKKGRIIGYVHIKDIIRSDHKRGEPLHPRDVRKLVSVHANQSIRMTLKIMQHSGSHIALVQNGNKVLGLVTFEDVLEELVGEMSQHKALKTDNPQ